jgi:chromosome segregation ATPase
VYKHYKRTSLDIDLEDNMPSKKIDYLFHLVFSSLNHFIGILCSLKGPLLDLFKRQLSQIEAERDSLRSCCTSSENQLALLKKQVEANEIHQTEYLKRYEEAISDKQKISKDYAARVTELQSKCSKLEERCVTLADTLDVTKRECSEWKRKHDRASTEQKAEEDKLRSQVAALESRVNMSEGRLAAVREQAESARDEASEWKKKYELAVAEAKSALQRAAIAQERTSKKVQEREDALRAELADQLAAKVIHQLVVFLSL